MLSLLYAPGCFFLWWQATFRFLSISEYFKVVRSKRVIRYANSSNSTANMLSLVPQKLLPPSSGQKGKIYPEDGGKTLVRNGGPTDMTTRCHST